MARNPRARLVVTGPRRLRSPVTGQFPRLRAAPYDLPAIVDPPVPPGIEFFSAHCYL